MRIVPSNATKLVPESPREEKKKKKKKKNAKEIEREKKRLLYMKQPGWFIRSYIYR